MRIRQIAHVDAVTDAGAISHIVLIAKDLDRRAHACHSFYYQRNPMRPGIVPLENLTIGIIASGIFENAAFLGIQMISLMLKHMLLTRKPFELYLIMRFENSLDPIIHIDCGIISSHYLLVKRETLITRHLENFVV